MLHGMLLQSDISSMEINLSKPRVKWFLANPLTPNDLERSRAVNTLKIKIPSKNIHKKPTNTPIILSVY
jgi:hypothetical protein